MAILIIVLVIFLVLLVGMLLAFLFTRMSHMVVTTQEGMVAEERAYNPGLTMGHRIKVDSDYEEQLKEARKEAAKAAAALPRGANNRIGRAGQSTLTTAGKNVSNDPLTAVRIARFHGWDGARAGIPPSNIPTGGVAQAVAAPTAAAAPVAVGIAPPKLIEITDNMPPEEVRKARIANAKAESAYKKALKEAGSGAAVPVATGAPTAAPVTAPPVPAAVNIEPPKLIEITPDMPPEDVRKARVANAKAEAAYNKALKAAGVTPGSAQVSTTQPAEATPVATTVAAAPAPPAAIGIEPPKLIDITDNMPPEEVRRARVANAKAQAAYNKALKAAGVDPSSMNAQTTAVADAPQASTAPPMQEAAAPAQAPAAAPAIPAGIDPPKLTEITDSMSPEEIRRARVENAKATAAYNKALKAEGIDPASLK